MQLISTLFKKQKKKGKRKLVRAWDKMKTWLREESAKLEVVIDKHARLQAVGALHGEAKDNNKPSKIRVKSASYDLDKARAGEPSFTCETKELELLSVSKDELDGGATTSSSSLEQPVVKNSTEMIPSALKKKTMSSDNILCKSKLKLAPVSFSMDELSSSNSHGGEKNETTKGDEVVADCNETMGSGDKKQSSKGAGLIKRRMLGSIRGLMTSTNLLGNDTNDEVPTTTL